MMPRPFSPSPFLVLCTLAVAGCSLPPTRPASVTKDRAFISYSAPPADTGKTRLAVKDLIDIKGEVTSAGSEYLALHGTPATKDAACLLLAREQGVEIVGKTNLPEFAVSVSGINDYFGTARNRQSKSRRLIPGGSSSGSAAAVADGLADVAFGTDTAGSIRVPAACCGIAGLKTTYGLVPLEGVYPVSPKHLDTVGPMARDIAGLVRGMDLLQRGFSGRYAAAAAAEPNGSSLRVARFYVQGTDPEIDRAIDLALIAAGFRVVYLNEDFGKAWEDAEKNGYTIAAADAWRQNEEFLDKEQVSARAKAVLLLGDVEYRLNYEKALRNRRPWERTLRRVFSEVDFIALPTLKKLPPTIPLIGRTPIFEALVLSLQNTVPVNFAGLPALALPVPLEKKRGQRQDEVALTSLQLIGPKRSEAALLNAGRIVEKTLP